MSVTMNKRPWSIRTLFPLAAAVLLVAAPAGFAEPPAQHIDVGAFKSQVEDVVIPNPSEVFAALDKMGSPNWTGAERPVSSAKLSHPEEISMLLGVVIADGFIAVEAKDKESVDKIGRRVLELSTALGVQKAVSSHSNAIIEAAKNDNWSAVRSELDKAKGSVREGMDRLGSKDNAELVSIAGWLRGTNALTSLINADYKPERAELLHQPDLLVTFERQFSGMNKKEQENKRVAELREGLKKVKSLIPTGANDNISQKTVEEINGITADLVKSLAP